MRWFRTIGGFVRVLAALFVIAQFAGVVSSPLTSAEAFADAADNYMHRQHMHDQHMHDQQMHGQDHQGSAAHHGDPGGGHVDHCCALHAFFAGILPPIIAVKTADTVDQRLVADVIEIRRGVAPGRLDRPPRPHVVI